MAHNATAAGDLVGVDIGGTKTHGIRFHAGIPLAEAHTGSANVQNVPVETARANLAELFDRLGAGPIARVIAGAGGVDTPDDARRLRDLLVPLAPGAAVDVVHDTRLILAAGDALTGIAVIAGTGSVAWGIDAAGRQSRAGGWGHLLGDEGSGYWIGREAVRRTLHRADLGREPDDLGRRLLAACALDSPTELIHRFHSAPDRDYWAATARLVFDAAADGDTGARGIIDDAAGHLASLAVQAARTLGLDGPVVIGGGMAAHQALLRAPLAVLLAEAGLTDVRFLDRDPVFGVLRLAGTPSRGTDGTAPRDPEGTSPRGPA